MIRKCCRLSQTRIYNSIATLPESRHISKPGCDYSNRSANKTRISNIPSCLPWYWSAASALKTPRWPPTHTGLPNLQLDYQISKQRRSPPSPNIPYTVFCASRPPHCLLSWVGPWRRFCCPPKRCTPLECFIRRPFRGSSHISRVSYHRRKGRTHIRSLVNLWSKWWSRPWIFIGLRCPRSGVSRVCLGGGRCRSWSRCWRSRGRPWWISSIPSI